MSPLRELRRKLLVIVLCGIAKIWDKYPDAEFTR